MYVANQNAGLLACDQLDITESYGKTGLAPGRCIRSIAIGALEQEAGIHKLTSIPEKATRLKSYTQVCP